MSALINLRPEADWDASSGLFDWVLEFLIPRLSDQEAAARLKEIVDNHLGDLWLSEFPAATQREIVSHLRDGLIEAAERELPESDVKEEAVDHLRELVHMTYN